MGRSGLLRLAPLTRASRRRPWPRTGRCPAISRKPRSLHPDRHGRAPISIRATSSAMEAFARSPAGRTCTSLPASLQQLIGQRSASGGRVFKGAQAFRDRRERSQQPRRRRRALFGDRRQCGEQLGIDASFGQRRLFGREGAASLERMHQRLREPQGFGGGYRLHLRRGRGLGGVRRDARFALGLIELFAHLADLVGEFVDTAFQRVEIRALVRGRRRGLFARFGWLGASLSVLGGFKRLARRCFQLFDSFDERRDLSAVLGADGGSGRRRGDRGRLFVSRGRRGLWLPRSGPAWRRGWTRRLDSRGAGSARRRVLAWGRRVHSPRFGAVSTCDRPRPSTRPTPTTPPSLVSTEDAKRSGSLAAASIASLIARSLSSLSLNLMAARPPPIASKPRTASSKVNFCQ